MSSLKTVLDLSRPWLTEKTVSWPVLPSVFLRKEQAFRLKAFDLPILLRRIRYLCGTVATMSKIVLCHFRRM